MRTDTWIVHLCFAAAMTASCKPPEAPVEPEATEERRQPTTLVETVLLDTVDFQETLELTGETEPVRAAFVSAQIGGRITDLDLVEGQWVEEGTTVMRLSSAQGRATIDRLEVQIAGLDGDIERAERLIDRGLGRQADLEALEVQQATLRESIGEVEAGVRETRHRAPISGIVNELYFEEGEFAGQGREVVRIIDLTTIVVSAGLPERNITFVREGTEVEVRIEATGEVRRGVLSEIGLEANPRNRTFPLEIQLDNTDGSLRAGMRTTVLLVKRNIPDALVIPRDAILQAIGGHEVMLVVDNHAQARPVLLGPGQGRFVVVTEGLSPGEHMVVRGHRSLVQGEPTQSTRHMRCCAEQFRGEAAIELEPPPPAEPVAEGSGSAGPTDDGGSVSGDEGEVEAPPSSAATGAATAATGAE